MRHLFRALPLWALLLGVASCDKEDIVAGGNGAEASGERVPMTFTALAIDLQEETAATANFSGEASPGAESYLAFYPYSEGLACTDGAIHFTLPVTQTAQAGSFAPGVNPAWAQTTEAGGQLTFHNAAALVKFTLKAEDAAQPVASACL